MISSESILDRMISPLNGGFSEEHSRYILSLKFTNEEQAYFGELSDKAQAGKLSPEEQGDIDHFLTVNAMLMMLQSKARMSLKKLNSAA